MTNRAEFMYNLDMLSGVDEQPADKAIRKTKSSLLYSK
jgi:hypothetical protein